MKLNKILLITALSLFAATGLMAKDKAKKEEIPGVAPQPAEFFYTGKPYDKDLGAYTFNYRNYDPSTIRWTSADPSGFPDGANNFIYVINNPLNGSDFDGLQVYYQYIYREYGGIYTATYDKDIPKFSISINVSKSPGVSITPSATTIKETNRVEMTNEKYENDAPTGSQWKLVESLIISSGQSSNNNGSTTAGSQTTTTWTVTAWQETRREWNE
ncbi:MAG: RHS repeat-associated core domain-containing protein [Verrucomicrobiota bacterium]